MEALNSKFVGEVKKYPELYNYTLQGYSKRDVIEKTWNNVANTVNFSVDECKEKWRNLRSTFVRNLKPKPSGSGTTRKKPYYLMEAMQFAIPFVKVAGIPTGNLPKVIRPSTPSSTENDIFDLEEVKQDNKIKIFDNSLISPSLPPLIPTLCQDDEVGTRSTSRKTNSLPTRKRRIPESCKTDKAFASYFTAKQAKMLDPPPKKDEIHKREKGIKHFLKSLIPDLMQLNDAQLRNFKRNALVCIDELVIVPTEL